MISLSRIADAKARGVYKGRKASIDPAKIKQMKADGMGPSAIAKKLRERNRIHSHVCRFFV
jgi:DNA invertase Pin-like site-specific DNA recombinase